MDEAAPTLRLPPDTRPTSESIELAIDPAQDRFSGSVAIAITLERPRGVLWLHGRDLHVTRASITPEGGAEIPATWRQVDERGTASLTPLAPVPAGRATVRVAYDGAFGTHLDGLHKVSEAGVPYAFTQFESTSARRAFPCFDEPGIKIPFDVALLVPSAAQAIANTREIDRATSGSTTRVHFAPTLPLPSYLLAFAVGPLDVVNAPDVPPNAVRKEPLHLRGVAAKGRGKEMGYALAHTGEILATLEEYFGIPYPYDKLDILAVPDKQGAMENAGAITYWESALLIDEKTASISQRRAFASVSAHEMAHQWFGDLVTAAWWDDIWLNEAFATWMAAKTMDAWEHDDAGSTSFLQSIQGAMRADALVSARAVRQPIESPHDIENAFDAITYEKGGAVLAMFERWLGPEVFQRGVRAYLARHRFGAATADDFLDAMSSAAGKDVKAPFHTFLDRPGVPFIQAETTCSGGAARLHVKQSRYLPLGSTGDREQTWQVPVCARYGVGSRTREACALITEPEGDVPLGDTCPAWVLPNAEAAGYYHFGLAPADLARLRSAGFASLDRRERVALGDALRAALDSGTLPMKDAFLAAEPFAADSHEEVAAKAMGLVGRAHDWLWNDPVRPAIEAYGRRLYRGPFAKLGWAAARGEGDDRGVLRRSVVVFLALVARDPAVRAEARRRALAYLGYRKEGAIHPEAVDANLVWIVLAVAAEDADVALWDAMRAHLAKTEDAILRIRLLSALASSHDPELVKRARELVFDPSLRTSEVTETIWTQLDDPETRDSTWAWVEASYERIVARVAEHNGKSQLIAMAGAFCDAAHAADAEAFFATRVAAIEGGPRELASTIENVRLCAARREAQEGSARLFFSRR